MILIAGEVVGETKNNCILTLGVLGWFTGGSCRFVSFPPATQPRNVKTYGFPVYFP